MSADTATGTDPGGPGPDDPGPDDPGPDGPAPDGPAPEGPEDDLEELPGPEDPLWDEFTDSALGALRRLRAAHRRTRAIESAYNAYVVVLVLAVYGGALVAYALRAGGRQGGAAPAALAATLPSGLTAAALLLLLTGATTGTWRGPVTVDAPTVRWLLPQPIRWGVVLRPRWRLSLLLSAVVGVFGGVVVGLALASLRVVDVAPGVGGAALSGLVLGVASAGLGGLTETRPGFGRAVSRLAWLVRLVVVGLAVQAALAASGRRAPALETVERWSGPWGWVVQPVLAAAGAPAGGSPRWPLAVALAAVVAVALAVGASRGVAVLRGAALRARAATWSQVSGSVGTFDFRLARTSVDAARGRRTGTRLRLPRPRSAATAVLWRDATALLRDPGRPVAAVLWAAGGILLALLATATEARTGLGALALSLLAIVAAYRAAGILLEPARLESDDRRRSVQLPFAAGDLALRHTVVPLVVLGVVGVAGVVVAFLTGRPPAAEVTLLAAAPALVGGALVGAYRGPVPMNLLVGIDSPVGNTGGVQVVFWYLRGALVAVVPTIAAVAIPLLRGSGADVAVAGLLVVGIAMLAWGRSRATSLAAPAKD